MQLALPRWHASVEWRVSPYVDFEGLRRDGTTYLAALSRNTREQLRRAVRHFERKGPLRIELPDSLETSLKAFVELQQLHAVYWNRRGKAGGFATPHRQSFHRRFISEGYANGRAQVLRVLCGDQLIGVLYNLAANGHVAFYQSGFKYDDDPRSRPGLVSHFLAIQHYFEAGMREYDFLPSGPGEGRYKSSLANASRRLGTLTLARPGWRREGVEALRRIKSIMSPRMRHTS
jgi:CelD/BcsL family acetyltransferase involved in cellulose biosynthesis